MEDPQHIEDGAYGSEEQNLVDGGATGSAERMGEDPMQKQTHVTISSVQDTVVISQGKNGTRTGVTAGARFFNSGSTHEPGLEDSAGFVVTPDATIDSRPLEQGDQNVTENKKQIFNPFGSDFSVASLNTEK